MSTLFLLSLIAPARRRLTICLSGARIIDSLESMSTLFYPTWCCRVPLWKRLGCVREAYYRDAWRGVNSFLQKSFSPQEHQHYQLVRSPYRRLRDSDARNAALSDLCDHGHANGEDHWSVLDLCLVQSHTALLNHPVGLGCAAYEPGHF